MPNKLPSILLGGLVAGILSTSYLGLINFICCLGVILGAITAVWHYTTTHEVTIPTGQGALLGVLAALAGLAIGYVLGEVTALIGLPSMQDLQTSFMSRFYTPEMMEQAEAMQEQQEGFSGMMLVGILIGAVVTSIFGAIGGAIGAAIFKKGPAEPETDTF